MLRVALIFLTGHILLFPWVAYGVQRQLKWWNHLMAIWLVFGFLALVLGLIRLWPIIWELQ